MSTVPLSILDRANARLVNGRMNTAADVFAELTARAQAAEQLGYHRFWVAEHHSVPGIAGSAPTLLAAHLASATSSIRIGTGGIMVPSHRPLIIAEQIATLQALAGRRFDAGLGASLGFTQPVREALGQAADAKARFPDDVDEVLAYLHGTAQITAYPQDAARTQLFILTGGGSAEFAGTRGLGMVLGGPAVTNGLKATREINGPMIAYRNTYQPAKGGSQASRIIASVNVAVAETHQQAEQLVLSEAWALTRSRSIGVFQPLEDPTVIPTVKSSEQEQRRLANALATTVYGTQDDVVEKLQRILTYTRADEILVTGNMWDTAAQRTSDRLLAEAWMD